MPNRRQPLLTSTPETQRSDRNGRRRKSRIGETAGECAAVSCCCPCVLMHLLILAVYRLPRGLWKKKKKKMLLRKKRKLSSSSSLVVGSENTQQQKRNSFEFEDEDEDTDGEDYSKGKLRNDDVAYEWEKEMWDRFYMGGFWRSESQRTTSDHEIEIKE